ncbi:glycosyltransferase family 4 protein [Marinilabilia rubra]|uniref:glycosyltransferase family 4 protein n=1 Tax=Marinilabilia rubra TaxID=2162893 RepID=UPI001304F0E1|nr:glycosyltransferase family 4 protein [Marinilabilia rubra]
MKLRVLSLIDSLVAAGAERVAVNISNGLVKNGVESHLCATRQEGPLKKFISNEVNYFFLGKRNFLDIRAFMQLINYIKNNSIQIVHAHSTSFSWAFGIKLFFPRIKVMWHIHHGNSVNYSKIRTWLLKNISAFFDFVFVVNQPLYKWGIEKLKIPESRISCLRNFPSLRFEKDRYQLEDLPKSYAFPKILHLAYFRPPKDHFMLLKAFARVREKYLEAQLYLVGGNKGDEYFEKVKQEIERLNSDNASIHVLGSRDDVGKILKNCHVGVLSSVSEGLPLALLEYGLAGLPVVCTSVGECSVVLNNGEFGTLVAPAQPDLFSKAIISVLDNPDGSKNKAKALKREVEMKYSEASVIDDITTIYNHHLAQTTLDLQ